MALSGFERLLLANQYRILEKLYPQEADDLAVRRKAIESGWELQIDGLFRDDGLTREQCVEVIDILDMFSLLKRSYDDAQAPTKLDEADITFKGFDGNYETEQWAYTLFLVEDEGKFTWLRRPNFDFNSHMPTLWRYRPMLAAWKAMGRPYRLTPEQIADVVAAGAAAKASYYP